MQQHAKQHCLCDLHCHVHAVAWRIGIAYVDPDAERQLEPDGNGFCDRQVSSTSHQQP